MLRRNAARTAPGTAREAVGTPSTWETGRPCTQVISPSPGGLGMGTGAFVRYSVMRYLRGWLIWAWAAARRAIGTRNGEQLT